MNHRIKEDIIRQKNKERDENVKHNTMNQSQKTKNASSILLLLLLPVVVGVLFCSSSCHHYTNNFAS